MVKLQLALKTYGTNDVYTYERFGVWAGYFGADLYNIAPDLNHPPSMLHFLRFLIWISGLTHLPFQFWIRFPGILADAGTLWLICRILGPRLGERSVLIATLLIAIAPINILISGFHGNTDPVMIFFVMLAVWLAGYRGNAEAGGLAYGMAICIKITPLVLAPVLLFSLTGAKRRFVFFLFACGLVLLAWSPYLFQQPAVVIRHVFGYKGSYGLWGVSWLLREVANWWPAAAWMNHGFSRVGSPLVMAAIVAVSLRMSRLAKQPPLYSQVGMVFLVFFTVTSGFAVQYLVWLTPWLAELGALPMAWFVLTASVFLLVVYNYWNLGMPWYLAIAYPWSPHQYFQVVCWISVIVLAIGAWHRMRHNRAMRVPVMERIPWRLRAAVAALGTAAFLVYPAIDHLRRDTLGVSPTYAEDDVYYEHSNEYQNLSDELLRRGRTVEADSVKTQAALFYARGQSITGALVRVQPARLNVRTPEDYVDASLDDYNRGDYEQCVHDATESLKHRPGMPAAWNNISLCQAGLGKWDEAVAAAVEGLRIEPESDEVRQNLDWAIAGQRGVAADR